MIAYMILCSAIIFHNGDVEDDKENEGAGIYMARHFEKWLYYRLIFLTLFPYP